MYSTEKLFSKFQKAPYKKPLPEYYFSKFAGLHFVEETRHEYFNFYNIFRTAINTDGCF